MNEKKSQDKISVIIPVYNTAPYLKRCLDSVLQSTYRNLEIICVNDGSTDASLSILEQYQALDDRVVVIDQNNRGLSAARNTGMARATGDFISFVDSDDWVHPQMFEVLRNAMDEDVSMAVCSNKRVYHQEPMELLGTLPSVRIYPSLREGYEKTTIRHYAWARLLRTANVIGIHFDEGITFLEDTIFNLMLAEKPGKCAVVEESLYFYFQRDTSLLHTASWEKYFEAMEKYIQRAKKESSICQSLIYEDVVKKAFAYRYEFMFIKEHNQAAKAARVCIREALNGMKGNRLISHKRIVVYTIMNDFPILYRIYRIALDLTLLDWEKKQKSLIKKLE